MTFLACKLQNTVLMMSSAHAELEAYVNSLTQQILPALDKIEDIHKILTKYKQTKVNSKLYKY